MHSTVTSVTLETSRVSPLTIIWKKANAHPAASPAATPSTERMHGVAGERRPQDESHAGDGEGQREVDDALGRRVQEARAR